MDTEINAGKKNNELSREDAEKLWDWALHEDNLLGNRINFCMVAVSLVFAALATIGSAEIPNVPLAYIIWVAGIIFCFIWFYVAHVQICFTIDPIKKTLRSDYPWYRKIAEQRTVHLSLNRLLGKLFPWVFAFILTVAFLIIVL